MKENTIHPVKNWLSQPSSWLSIIATLVSLITFFLVYAKKGEVRIAMPDRIGISLVRGDLSIMLPLTLTNTGAPRTVKHILRITANINGIAPLNVVPVETDVRWRMETKFVPRPGSSHLDDSIGYVNRAVPFAMFGGTSTQKLYELVQVGRGFDKKYIDGFNITVCLTTDNGKYYSTKAYYDCNHIELGNRVFQYCELPLLK